jgi:hypothetical protein
MIQIMKPAGTICVPENVSQDKSGFSLAANLFFNRMRKLNAPIIPDTFFIELFILLWVAGPFSDGPFFFFIKDIVDVNIRARLQYTALFQYPVAFIPAG